MSNHKNRKLRSQQWYGKHDRDGFIHRSWMKSQGLPDHAFDGRPIIGICNTWSEITPCNAHLRDIAEHVKKGVWEAGGVPLEFPAMSLGETQMRPTAMLFRNLLSMDVEESIRANPLDGVVLLGGCDKTTPGQVMGAASVDLPTTVISSGPMLSGKYRGQDIGSGTDVWKFSEQVRAGTMSLPEFLNAEGCMSRSPGTCMTMGTASTMASLMEAMGMALPLNASIPAVDARRKVLAHLTGMRMVEMVHEDLTISKVLTRKAFENAIKVNAAIGGSTNAVVHLLAIAGRLGVELDLEDFDRLGREVPLLVNLMPSGQYLMEDFHYNGGLPVVLQRLQDQLHLDAPSITGKHIGEALDQVECFNDDVIRPMDNPVRPAAGIAVLKGNLCPKGAIIKPSAASEGLLKHRGQAVVFETIEDFKARIDDPNLEVDENSILVLKGCGPKGYPGMPEVGNMPLPPKVLEKGVTDMVRLSDARMSGTAFGTVVLHISPEANEGGPLALVENGDWIEMDVEARKLHLDISDEELARRQQAWEAPESPHKRGYYRLYIDHVMQADEGADLDFLKGSSGHVVTRESH
ncbi:L-arabinonate dehydratase [Marinobacter mangrovi]|uniref:L-arabinonate dehydratase n=1 Tax=Marinobacter mangrovi TaxID=2803918 RepID=UPI0019324F7C|nr:L-arabinonate dehydratase [Marinobacter mangrovi]